MEPGPIETVTLPARSLSQPAMPMMTPTDPFMFMLQLPFLPLMMMMQMQYAMMQNMMSMYRAPSQGLKIVTLRRDSQGNIIEIMERG